jgi:transcriptional regulator with XRE-family HTH domain
MKKQKDRTLSEVVGGNIKSLRRLRRLTQAELAEALGVEIMTISRYERSIREPSLEQLQAIAKILDVIPARLLIDEESKAGLADSLSQLIDELPKRDAELALALVQQISQHRHAKP